MVKLFILNMCSNVLANLPSVVFYLTVNALPVCISHIDYSVEH